MGHSCFFESENVKKVAAALQQSHPEFTAKDIEAIMNGAADKYNVSEPTKQQVDEYLKEKNIVQPTIEEVTIEYTPIGKETQTYTIKGVHIYNKKGEEVFKEDSRDRNKIFANLAVKQGRAVVVEHKGTKYIVNDRGAIMSTSKSNSGAIMRWGPENGDRKAILAAANAKFTKLGQQQVQTLADKFPIQKHTGNWTRQEAQNNPRILYVFTDNTDRDSGSGLISSDSWYSKKYGIGHHYPTMTAAVVRGLENARPISTQRWYHQGAKGPTGRWTDANVEEFKRVIRAELEDIVVEFNTGKYDTIMFPDGDGLFNTSISNITMQRTPKLYQALVDLLHEYGFDSLIPADITFSQQPATQQSTISQPQQPTQIQKRQAPEEVPISGFNMPNVNRAQFDEEVLRSLGSVTVKNARVELIATMFSKVVDILIEDAESRGETIKDRQQFILDNLGLILGTNVDEVDGELPLMFEENDDPYVQTEFDKFNMSHNSGVWMALLEEASPIIQAVEGIVINTRNKAEEYGEGEQEEWEASGENILSLRDGWMIRAREIDLKDSLSAKTRRILARIPLTLKRDSDGEPVYEYDDLGFPRYLNPDYAHVRLLQELSQATDPKSFDKLLEGMVEKEPWVENILDILDEDETIRPAFYGDLRKEFVSYWVHTTNRRGETQTKEVNKEPSIQYFFNEWVHNYDNHIILSDISLYDKDGNINKSNIEKIQKKWQDFDNMLNENSSLETSQIDKKVIDDLQALLKAIGVSLTDDEIEKALYQKTENRTAHIRKIAGVVGDIVNQASSKPIKQSPFMEYKGFYETLAETLDLIPEGVTMASFREKGKMYQSFTNPSWLGRFITAMHGENAEKFIQDQYGNFRIYKTGDKWRSPWMELLMTDKKYRDMIQRKVILHSDSKEYDKWTSADYFKIIYNEFFSTNKNDSANYYVPILADAPSAEFIRFVRYTGNYKEQIAKNLYRVFGQELERIWLVDAREKVKAEKIQNLDRKESKKFLFFPGLNTADKNGLMKGQEGYESGTSFIEAYKELREDDRKNRANGSPTNKAQELAITAIRNEMEQGFAAFLDEVKDYGFNPETERGNLENFYWNNALAYTQIVQLTTTDLAYYKGVTDFQKRFKEVYSMTQRLYTDATWKGKEVFKKDDEGKAYETVVTLKDIQMVSRVMDEIRGVVANQIKQGLLTKAEGEYILSQFKKVNATDAQAWRSLDSFRAIMIGAGRWTDKMQEAFEHINSDKQGDWTIEDFNTMWLTIKPFLFTLSSTDSEVTLEDGTPYGKMPLPKQFKNSEMLLLALYGKIAMKEGDSPMLRAMSRVMNGEATQGVTIDSIQFESTEKVGGQAAVNLNGYIKNGRIYIIDNKGKIEEEIDFSGKNYKQGQAIIDNEEAIMTIMNAKLNRTVDGKTSIYDKAVKKVMMEDYGIQVTSPEHLLDHEGVIQSQFKKHITANLPEGFECEVAGKKYNADGVYRATQEILTENIIEGFKECEQLFGSKEAVEAELQKQMAGSTRYTSEDKKACTLVTKPDGTKDWAIPLFDPIQSQRIQTLLLSVVKKKVVNPQMRRSYLVQATGVGFSDGLQIRYYDINGEFIFTEAEFNGKEKARPKFQKLLKEKKDKYKTYDAYRASIKEVDEASKADAVAYQEIAMPLYSKALMDYCYDPETGTYDIDKLDDDLREGIGLRSPNEAKYSTQPIYIKYLLPSNNGSIVMYPNEITTIVGADFDYDKIMMYFHEYYMKSTAWKVYRELPAREKAIWESADWDVNSDLDVIFAGMEVKEDGSVDEKPKKELTPEEKGFRRFVAYQKENNYEFYRQWIKPAKIKYDPNKPTKSLTKKQRNNKFLDIAYAILTNPKIAGQMHSPGNFDILKQQALVKQILNKVSFNELADTLGLSKQKNETADAFKERVYKKLDETEYDDLKVILNKFASEMDPKSAQTQLYFHRQNSNASNMIGIYAVAGGSHSLLQHTNTALSKPTEIMGVTISKIDGMYDLSGKLLSKNIEQFLAASVDDVKEPVLRHLMQNPNTANITNGLIRMGFPISVATSMVVAKNYPYIAEDSSNDGKQIKDWELMELIQLQSQDNLSTAAHSESIKNNIKNEADKMSFDDRKRMNDLMIKLNNTLMVINPICNSIQDLTLVLRSDAPNNAAGPTLGHVLSRFIKYVMSAKRLVQSNIKSDAFDYKKLIGDCLVWETLPNGKKRLTVNWETAVDFALNNGYDTDQMREEAYNNPIPFIQAATKAGVFGPMRLLQQYFPQLNPAIVKILVDNESGLTRYVDFDHMSTDNSAKMLNKVINEFLLYTLNATDFFGRSTGTNGVLSESKLYNSGYYLLAFPDQVRDFLQAHESLRENNRFLANLEFPIKNGIRMIEFKDAKDLSQTEKTKISDSWAELAMSEDAEVRNLANTLFKYGSFMGLAYSGPKSFVHLAPAVLRNSIGDYTKGLNYAITSRTSEYVSPFVGQFIRNNYNITGFKKVTPKSLSNYTIGADEIAVSNLKTIKTGTDVIQDEQGRIQEVDVYATVILLNRKLGDSWITELFVKGDEVLDGNNKIQAVKYKKLPTLGINGFKEYYNGQDKPVSVLDIYERKVYNEIQDTQSANFSDPIDDDNYDNSIGEDEIPDEVFNQPIIVNPAPQQEPMKPEEPKDPLTQENICGKGVGSDAIPSGDMSGILDNL